MAEEMRCGRDRKGIREKGGKIIKSTKGLKEGKKERR
jgi:hypothetical protein